VGSEIRTFSGRGVCGHGTPVGSEIRTFSGRGVYGHGARDFMGTGRGSDI